MNTVIRALYALVCFSILSKIIDSIRGEFTIGTFEVPEEGNLIFVEEEIGEENIYHRYEQVLQDYESQRYGITSLPHLIELLNVSISSENSKMEVQMLFVLHANILYYSDQKGLAMDNDVIDYLISRMKMYKMDEAATDLIERKSND